MREGSQGIRAEVRCLVCGEQEPVLWASVSEYEYLRCLKCGLLFLNRIPSAVELKNFYNTSFQVDRSSQGKKIARRSGTLLEMLRKLLPENGRLLDVGCSYGHFLGQAKRVGWQVEGVEISHSAANWAREEFGVPVHAGTLDNVLHELAKPYDAIVMLHVIEHSPEPACLISEIRQLLRPGGILVIKTPNSSSWIARFCRKTWEWLTPPAHIYLFSPASLRLLLEKTEFRIESIETLRGDAHNTLFQITQSAAKWVFGRNGSVFPLASVAPSRKDWYQRVEATSDLLYAPFEPLERMLFPHFRHPEILAFARKKDGAC